MAKVIREYQIRPMVCDWALDIPMGNTTFVLHFNSRNNAELVKAILEWEDSHPNEAIPYQPTLTPPNEALTLNELREMDGEPVWVDDEKTWAILQVWDDQNIDAVFPIQRGCFRAESVLGMKIYRRPPEGEEYT